MRERITYHGANFVFVPKHTWYNQQRELAALRAVAGVAREVLDVVGAEGKIGEWDSGCVIDRLSGALDTLDELENGTTARTTPTD